MVALLPPALEPPPPLAFVPPALDVPPAPVTPPVGFEPPAAVVPPTLTLPPAALVPPGLEVLPPADSVPPAGAVPPTLEPAPPTISVPPIVVDPPTPDDPPVRTPVCPGVVLCDDPPQPALKQIAINVRPTRPTNRPANRGDSCPLPVVAMVCAAGFDRSKPVAEFGRSCAIICISQGARSGRNFNTIFCHDPLAANSERGAGLRLCRIGKELPGSVCLAGTTVVYIITKIAVAYCRTGAGNATMSS